MDLYTSFRYPSFVFEEYRDMPLFIIMLIVEYRHGPEQLYTEEYTERKRRKKRRKLNNYLYSTKPPKPITFPKVFIDQCIKYSCNNEFADYILQMCPKDHCRINTLACVNIDNITMPKGYVGNPEKEVKVKVDDFIINTYWNHNYDLYLVKEVVYNKMNCLTYLEAYYCKSIGKVIERKTAKFKKHVSNMFKLKNISDI